MFVSCGLLKGHWAKTLRGFFYLYSPTTLAESLSFTLFIFQSLFPFSIPVRFCIRSRWTVQWWSRCQSEDLQPLTFSPGQGSCPLALQMTSGCSTEVSLYQSIVPCSGVWLWTPVHVCTHVHTQLKGTCCYVLKSFTKTMCTMVNVYMWSRSVSSWHSDLKKKPFIGLVV